MNSKIILASLLAASLTACGGGGGGGGGGGDAGTGSTPPPSTPPPSTPPPSGITASGVITGFSSVFVNGERYEVASDTVVSIEDEQDVSGDDSILRVGMKVRVEATEDDNVRTASRIEYDDDLKGPARNVTPNATDPATGTLTVLRQTVIVDANTVFDDDVGDNNGDGSIDIRDLTLASGEVVVEVSGLPVEDGFLATRIDRDNAAGVPGVDDDEYEVKGFVDSVAADGSSFTINGATFLVVEGAGGTIFDDGLSANEALVGVYVEVEADEDTNGDLLAVHVEREDQIGDTNSNGDIDDNDREGQFEIKSILTSVDTTTDPHTVVIGGTTLRVADASSLEGLEGKLIELEGSFDENGVLLIEEVHPEVENSIHTEDRIASIDSAAATFTTRLGLTITPDGASRVDDDLEEGGDHLTPQQFIDRLQPDNFIEARGFPQSDGTVSWTRVEREDEDEDDQECELRGPVEAIDGTSASDFSFTILSVTIDVSQITSDNDFEGVNGLSIGRQAFFDQLSVGDIIEAESDEDGLGCEDGRLTAQEVGFELEDGVVGSTPSPADGGSTSGGDDGGNPGGTGAREITGTPGNVGASSFELGGTVITVTGSTLIDDSIIERALGREFNGDDQRFDQLPAGLTLTDLLTGDFEIAARVSADNVALEVEDL